MRRLYDTAIGQPRHGFSGARAASGKAQRGDDSEPLGETGKLTAVNSFQMYMHGRPGHEEGAGRRDYASARSRPNQTGLPNSTISGNVFDHQLKSTENRGF
jgi:hypothetical protein